MSATTTFETSLAEYLATARGGVRLPRVVQEKLATFLVSLGLEDIQEVEGLDVDTFAEAATERLRGGVRE